MLAIAPLALLAGLAGCGSDNATSDTATPVQSGAPSETSDSSASVQSSAPSATTATSEGGTDPEATVAGTTPSVAGEVKIMVIAPDTNVITSGSYPEMAVGARAAAKALNDGGGVNGAEVVIDVCDTKGDANEAVNCAQKAIDAGDYVAVVSGTDNEGNYAEPLRNAGIPNVAPYLSAALLADANSYPLYSGQLGLFFAGMTVLLPENPASLAMVYVDSGALGAQLQALAAGFTAAHPDIKINFVPISPNQGDYSSIVQTAAESDVIFLGVASEPLIRFVQTADQLGIEKPISVPSGTIQGAALDELGDLANGLLATAAFTTSTDAAGEAEMSFRNAMDAVDADASKTDFAANAYAGVYTIAAALDGATEMTAATLKAGLDKLTGLDLGILPIIQFSTPSPTFGPQVTRVFNDKLLNVKIADGKFIATSDFVNVLTGQ